MLTANQMKSAAALGITMSLSLTAARYLSAKFPSLGKALPQSDGFSDDIKFGGAFALMSLTYGVIYNVVSR